MTFFKGEVTFLKQGHFKAQYRVKNSTCIICIIKVKNNTHVRCFDQAGMIGHWPDLFEILAPMDAVTVVSGNVPADYIEEMDHTEYLAIRMMWDGF